MIRRAFRGIRHDDAGSHGDRPWVYFMIDSFFLVTQFFVLTFQMKSADDLILPHKLPVSHGCIHWNNDLVVPESVAVRVSKETPESRVFYSINGSQALDLAGISDKFGEFVSGNSPDKYAVKISYDGKVAFGDIMPIFNTCAKLRIKQCGLQISRDRTY